MNACNDDRWICHPSPMQGLMSFISPLYVIVAMDACIDVVHHARIHASMSSISDDFNECILWMSFITDGCM
ncbi:hypothetical protein [Neobacillus sp. OS1-33]|uniref:hypothetical protein n=1 Tax=Neobacillus sp. OS1-33 TaxID=3070683 RepID=UPI0027E20320|nr:hypothetical protein [Neobacillus sp. OS1-33]WML26311.1 hypothetical protein RCG22_01295 [Neobacillus sp. OS1-33]